ncbi:IS3 family transposase [Weissella koreensis]
MNINLSIKDYICYYDNKRIKNGRKISGIIPKTFRPILF